MPGHKGVGALGFESADITEIDGADSLYEAHGIIRESEENASALFGCPTFYSAEGSSLAIRAMLYLAVLAAREEDSARPPLVFAARNCHKTFVSAAALLDIDVRWLYPEAGGNYLSCTVTPQALDAALAAAERKPAAVYITLRDLPQSATAAVRCCLWTTRTARTCAFWRYRVIPSISEPMPAAIRRTKLCPC